MKMKKLAAWFGRGGGDPAPGRKKLSKRTCVTAAGLAMMAMMIVMQGLAWAQDKKEEPKVPAAAEVAKDAPKAAEKIDYNKKITEALATPKCAMDTMWTLITGMLVFFMNLGFATVESGMCRVKNAVNILSKNFIVFAASAAAYYFLGWGGMFG